MPAAPLPADVLAFLAKPNPAVVASLRPDGSPHSVPTWYDIEPDGLVLEGQPRLHDTDGRLRDGGRHASDLAARAHCDRPADIEASTRARSGETAAPASAARALAAAV